MAPNVPYDDEFPSLGGLGGKEIVAPTSTGKKWSSMFSPARNIAPTPASEENSASKSTSPKDNADLTSNENSISESTPPADISPTDLHPLTSSALENVPEKWGLARNDEGTLEKVLTHDDASTIKGPIAEPDSAPSTEEKSPVESDTVVDSSSKTNTSWADEVNEDVALSGGDLDNEKKIGQFLQSEGTVDQEVECPIEPEDIEEGYTSKANVDTTAPVIESPRQAGDNGLSKGETTSEVLETMDIERKAAMAS